MGPKMGPKNQKKCQKRVTFGTPEFDHFGRQNTLFGGKKDAFLDHFLTPFWSPLEQPWAGHRGLSGDIALNMARRGSERRPKMTTF